AAASLIRPTDALAVALPLMFVPLVVMAWLRLEPLVAMLVGLLVGWSAWIGEAYARFGGPLQRLRDGSETNQGGLVNSIPEHIDALDGPSVLCRPHDVCAGIEPGAAMWWFALPVLAAVGLVAADDQPGVERLLELAPPPEPFDGPPPRHLADEVNLVTRWLEGAAGKAELLGVRGRLASPAIGGALLQLRYDPGRHRHAWPPGEARGRPEARPARPRRQGRHAGSFAGSASR
ncbi:MAG TPA: hypothetical protein VG637_10505, partial [Actinomycetes bacterium]|nr:hypothetical protein [Actinomycetes bacterium]